MSTEEHFDVIAELRAEILRQKIVFEAELRRQRETFEDRLDDMAREIDRAHTENAALQAAITGLGKKVDSLGASKQSIHPPVLSSKPSLVSLHQGPIVPAGGGSRHSTPRSQSPAVLPSTVHSSPAVPVVPRHSDARLIAALLHPANTIHKEPFRVTRYPSPGGAPNRLPSPSRSVAGRVTAASLHSMAVSSSIQQARSLGQHHHPPVIVASTHQTGNRPRIGGELGGASSSRTNSAAAGNGHPTSVVPSHPVTVLLDFSHTNGEEEKEDFHPEGNGHTSLEHGS